MAMNQVCDLEDCDPNVYRDYGHHQLTGSFLKLVMAAIAKRLFGTFATSTPEIGLTLIDFDWHW